MISSLAATMFDPKTAFAFGSSSTTNETPTPTHPIPPMPIAVDASRQSTPATLSPATPVVATTGNNPSNKGAMKPKTAKKRRHSPIAVTADTTIKKSPVAATKSQQQQPFQMMFNHDNPMTKSSPSPQQNINPFAAISNLFHPQQQQHQSRVQSQPNDENVIHDPNLEFYELHKTFNKDLMARLGGFNALGDATHGSPGLGESGGAVTATASFGLPFLLFQQQLAMVAAAANGGGGGGPDTNGSIPSTFGMQPSVASMFFPSAAANSCGTSAAEKGGNTSSSSGRVSGQISPERDEGEDGQRLGNPADTDNDYLVLNRNDFLNAALGRSNCSGEPEDLSLGRKIGLAPDDAIINTSAVANAARTTPSNNWSFEEQFKQLYELSDDGKRKEWLDDWLGFMHQINKPVTRIPIMAKQVLDLYELYRLVVQHGGIVEVINKKLWREITKGLNLPNSITSAAFTLRTQYEKFLYDYECARHNFSDQAELRAAIDANKREGRRGPGQESTPNGRGGRGTPGEAASKLGSDCGDAASDAAGGILSQHQAAAMMAAAFFGKQFGAPFGMGGIRDDDLQQQLISTLGNQSTAIQQAAALHQVLRLGSAPFNDGEDTTAAATVAATTDAILPPFAAFLQKTADIENASGTRSNDEAGGSGVSFCGRESVASSYGGSSSADHNFLSNGPSNDSKYPRRDPPDQAENNRNMASRDEDAGCPESFSANLNMLGQLLARNSSSSAAHLKLTSTSENSMMVSMEVNGVVYQGVLFAIDAKINDPLKAENDPHEVPPKQEPKQFSIPNNGYGGILSAATVNSTKAES